MTSLSVAAARRLLQSARDELDVAVQEVPDVEGDNTMATPALLALLLRVVAARRHLTGLEVAMAAEVAATRARTSTPK